MNNNNLKKKQYLCDYEIHYQTYDNKRNLVSKNKRNSNLLNKKSNFILNI